MAINRNARFPLWAGLRMISGLASGIAMAEGRSGNLIIYDEET